MIIIIVLKKAMVICLQKVKDYFLQYLVLFLVLVLIYYIGYIFSYFKYNNSNNIINNALRINNNILKSELYSINTINDLDISFDYDISKVMYQNMYNNNEFIIYNNDYSIGDIAINDKGLVGIIYNIKDNKCYLKQIDSDINLSVKINDTYGILNNSVVTMLDKYSEINEGDKVYTSGLTSIPENIYVGEVIKTYYSNDNLGKIAIIKLLDYNSLNYVAILEVNDDI